MYLGRSSIAVLIRTAESFSGCVVVIVVVISPSNDDLEATASDAPFRLFPLLLLLLSSSAVLVVVVVVVVVVVFVYDDIDSSRYLIAVIVAITAGYWNIAVSHDSSPKTTRANTAGKGVAGSAIVIEESNASKCGLFAAFATTSTWEGWTANSSWDA